MNKKNVLAVIEKTYKKISENNPYTNFNFVDKLISDKVIVENVKKIINGGTVSKTNRKFNFEHLHDYLMEHNKGLAYLTIADYMMYPKSIKSLNEDYDIEDTNYNDEEYTDDYEDMLNKALETIDLFIEGSDFPIDWNITTTKTEDYVEVDNLIGYKCQILPEKNGNYTLRILSAAKGENDFNNLSLETACNKIISLIHRTHLE